MPLGSTGIPPLTSITGLNLILSALRLVGSIGSGETLSASEIQDAGMVFNQMIDSWNAQRATIFVVQPVTANQNGAALALAASQQKYLLGNTLGTEDFLLTRPPRLERVSVLYSASQSTPVEVPMEMVDDVGWQGISNKTTTSILPQVCYAEPDFPDMSLYFWPVPTQANPVTLYLWQQLIQMSDLYLPIAYPPGYLEAMRYNLAVRLFAEFPGNPAKFPVVQKLASDSLQAIRSQNRHTKEAFVDRALTPRGGTGNIYTGSTSRAHKY